jgi:hypothetical protein
MSLPPTLTSSKVGVIRALSSQAVPSTTRTVANSDGTCPPGDREKAP